MPSSSLDVVVIGRRHNGLTCACYLAAAGLKVRVVERRRWSAEPRSRRSSFPGFRNSTASYTVSLLNPKVIRGPAARRAPGCGSSNRPFSNFVPLHDGRALRFGGDLAENTAEVSKFSRRDAERLPALLRTLDRLADQLKQWVLRARA